MNIDVISIVRQFSFAKVFIALVWVVMFSAMVQSPVYAAASCKGLTVVAVPNKTFEESDPSNSLELTITGLPIGNYEGTVYKRIGLTGLDDSSTGPTLNWTVSNPGDSVTVVLNDPKHFEASPLRAYRGNNYLFINNGLSDKDPNYRKCSAHTFNIQKESLSCTSEIYQDRGIDADGDGTPDMCFGGAGGCLDTSAPIFIRTTVKENTSVPAANTQMITKITGGGGNPSKQGRTDGDGVIEHEFTLPAGVYSALIEKDGWIVNRDVCATSFAVQDSCGADECTAEAPRPEANEVNPYKICDQVKSDPAAYQECQSCAGDEENPGGIWTAVGCISREPGAIVEKFITIGLGIAGGFSLLSTMTAGFMYSISAGDANKVAKAKEMMTNSIIGLIFVIFSVTILQFIGYTVFRIPGFGG